MGLVKCHVRVVSWATINSQNSRKWVETMKRNILAVLFCLMLSSPLGAVPGRNAAHEDPGTTGTLVAQELMELQVPGEEGEHEMELAPLRVEEKPQPEKVETLPLRGAPAEGMDVKAATPLPKIPSELLTMPLEEKEADEDLAVTGPAPGISPAVLPQPTEGPALEPSEVSGEILPAEVEEPVQLKTYQPPAVEAKGLRVPSEPPVPPVKAEAPPEVMPLPEKVTSLEIEETTTASAVDKRPMEIDVGIWLGLDRKLVEIFEGYYAKNNILQEGDGGFRIQKIQQLLRDRGYYNGPFHGRFTQELTRAVMEFQRDESLAVDGIVGPMTMKKMGLL